MLGIVLYDILIRKVNKRFILALGLTTLISLAIDYRLLLNTTIGVPSHRMEFVALQYGLKQAVVNSYGNFSFGQYHAPSIHHYFILITLVTVIAQMLEKSYVMTVKDRLLIKLLVVTVLISIWVGFNNWVKFVNLMSALRLNQIHLQYAFYIHPLLWYVIFALSLSLIIFNFKRGKRIVIILLALQIMLLFYKSDEVKEWRSGNPTYREFYSESLFQEIRDYIDKDQADYRVISIGLEPSISQYNGFYTLDAYLVNYPLEYKRQFRKIIEKELEKNKDLRNYYDTWGCRCYIFVDELGFETMAFKGKNIKIKKMQLNTGILKSMGGEYVFSAVEITNYEENNLKLMKVFEREDSPWKIYLYKLI